MDHPILQVARKRYTGESAVVSMRIPKSMLKDIDEAARLSGRTRNELISVALEFALTHMVITSTAGDLIEQPAGERTERKKR